MFTDKGLHRCRRIDIGNGNNITIGKTGCSSQLFPGRGYGGPTCHIRHGTAGIKMGQQYLLIFGGKNICGFGHKVNAAKNKKLPVLDGCSLTGEFQGISLQVRKPVHAVALIMMTEDKYPVSQFFFPRLYPGKDFTLFNPEILPADINLPHH